MHELELFPRDITQFEPLLEPAQGSTLSEAFDIASQRMDGRTIWHVNSTSKGGGVAEILQSVLSYLKGSRIATRWCVVEGDDRFFAITKRIHHFLHGSSGDGGSLGTDEKTAYLHTVQSQADELTISMRPGDVVVLHDPQTVGLAPHLRKLGLAVIWSCHVGTDEPNEFTRQAWRFLAPFAEAAQRVVFSRPTYKWDVLDASVMEVIPPCIDAFSPKNQSMDGSTVSAILARCGVIPGDPRCPASFTQQDGNRAVVESQAEMIQDCPISPDASLITQISRWDPLKDHRGVMEGFCRHVRNRGDAELVLAGPSPEAVGDDPEGGETLRDLCEARRHLPTRMRSRVHIACLPMNDLEANSAIVNALQRRSTVIVQKSLAEGFGLTVTEAMWKGVPTVASAVGGIQDQIEPNVSGLLVDPPDDLAAFGRAVTTFLDDPSSADRLGKAAHASVRDRYLAPSYLARFLDLAISVS